MQIKSRCATCTTYCDVTLESLQSKSQRIMIFQGIELHLNEPYVMGDLLECN